MKSTLVILLLLIIFTSITAHSSTDGVIIVDPNANGAITAKMYSETDLGLNQKVSYEAKFQSVEQILADLSEKTGIKLVAGARESDWPVRSRKMNIFVKDVPLTDLMDSIARVMKFRWSRYDNTKPFVYRLKVNIKAAAEADSMMRRAEEKKEAAWQKRRNDWIEAIMKYGAMSDTELAGLKETNPIVYEYAAKRGSLQAIRALFDEVPETKSRFAAGQPFRISADLLQPKTKEMLFNAGNELWRYLKLCGFLTGTPIKDPEGYTDEIKYDDQFDIVFARLDTEGFTPNLIWGAASIGDCGYFHILKGARDFEIAGLPSLDSAWDQYRSAAHIKILDGIEPQQAYIGAQGPRDQLTNDILKLWELLYPSEPLIEHEAFPEMNNKVKLGFELPKSETRILETRDYISSLQKELFDSTGFGIVSDAWVVIRGNRLSGSDMNLGDLLDKFAQEFNYNWDKQGAIIEFRHRKWAKMRLNQIPDEWIATWDQNTRDNGFLRLEDLAAISNLKFEQAEESLRRDKLLGEKGMYPQLLSILDSNGNVVWLRLYSLLTAQQKKLITSEHGLNGFMLTSAQWKIAQRMFDRLGITRGEAVMRLVYTVDNVAKSSNATFTEIDLDSSQVDRLWETYLPGYDPAWEKEAVKN